MILEREDKSPKTDKISERPSMLGLNFRAPQPCLQSCALPGSRKMVEQFLPRLLRGSAVALTTVKWTASCKLCLF